jgi:FixJ family two-component response regulator
MSNDPTVYIVEDDPDISRFLVDLLAASGLASEAFDRAETFLARYTPRSPQCALVDLRLPQMSGFELHRKLREGHSAIPVLIMSGVGTPTDAVEAMRNGAFDFLEKPLRGQRVLSAVRAALDADREGEETRRSVAQVQAKFALLTPRETEVLGYVVQGYSSKDIADDLGLSKKTVDLHRSHIMAKLEPGSLVNLVKMAIINRYPTESSHLVTETSWGCEARDAGLDS